ncbi:DUF2634 domain-containing protein [Paenibacillus elgii]
MIPQGGVLGNNRNVEMTRLPSRTYRLDNAMNRIVGMTDGLDAVKQAAQLILETERYEHLIYSDNYGREFSGLLGREPAFVQAELYRRIRAALMQDDRIRDVQDMRITVMGDEASASFTVVWQYGSFEMTKGVGAGV